MPGQGTGKEMAPKKEIGVPNASPDHQTTRECSFFEEVKGLKLSTAFLRPERTQAKERNRKVSFYNLYKDRNQQNEQTNVDLCIFPLGSPINMRIISRMNILRERKKKEPKTK